MGVYIWSRLPSEYQEVEYIQSSGTQRIDTGLKPTDATFGFKGKVSMTALSGDWILCALCGYTDSVNVSHYKYGFGGYASQWQTYNIMTSTIGWTNSGSLSLNTPYEFTFNYNSDRKLTVNGSDVKTGLTAGSYTYSRNWNLFCDTDDQTGYHYRYTSCKLYYFQIYKGTTLVRNFVPCYRKSDSVIGLYDLVNNQFYTNSGSGTFTKGSDVDTYRESLLKNAYIGEVYEYSYDFRNKSSTILTNDGWSILKGTPVFDSNGISCSGANTAIAKNIGNSVFANANKITMEYNFKLNSSSDTGFLICQTATSSSTVGNTGLYATSGSNLRQTSIFGTSTNISGMGSGTYKGKITLDLVGKTYTAEMTGKTTQTGTLTDTQISNIRNNIQVIRVSATNTSNTGVQDIYLCVE